MISPRVDWLALAIALVVTLVVLMYGAFNAPLQPLIALVIAAFACGVAVGAAIAYR